MKRDTEVAIFVALEEELQALMALLPGYREVDPPLHPWIVYETELPRSGKLRAIRIVFARTTESGQQHANTLCGQVIPRWKPRFIFIVGIAAAPKKKDPRLGDIVIGTRAHYYMPAKVTDTKHIPRHRDYPCSILLHNWAVAYARHNPNWHLRLQAPRPTEEPSLDRQTYDRPKVHSGGVVASGEYLIRSEEFMNSLVDMNDLIVAAEMESAGFCHAASEVYIDPPKPEPIIIRAITDYGDRAKSDLWRAYACEAAAAYCLGLIGWRLRPFLSREAENALARRRAHFAHTYPLGEHFTGRRAQRAMLSAWLRREQEYADKSVLVLVAIGGMGKSSVAWVWAKHDVTGEVVPGLARDTARLTSRGLTNFRLDFLLYWNFYEGGGSFEEFLEHAIEYFTEGHRPASGYTYGEGQARRIDHYTLQLDLLEILSTRRAVIIWDGAERLLREYAAQDASLREERPLKEIAPDDRDCADPTVFRFLTGVAGQSQSRLLLTTRLAFRELENLAGAGHVQLDGLDPEDAVQYLKSRGIRGTDDQLREAARMYDFHPLSLSNLAADILDDFDEEGNISAAHRHDPTEDLRRRREHILERAYQRREPHRRELLSRLAAVRGSIPRDIVRPLAAGIPGLELGHIGRDLGVLVKHGLLKHIAATGNCVFHPIVRRYAYNRLLGKTSIHASLAKHFQRLAASVDMNVVDKIEDLSAVIEFHHHIARSGQYDAAFAFFKNPLSTAKSLNQLLHFEFCSYQTLIESLEELFPDGLTSPPAVTTINQGAVLNDLALAYAKIGRPVQAASLLQRALASNELLAKQFSSIPALRRHADDQVALNLENLSTRYRDLGLLEAANDALTKAMKAYQRAGNEFGVAIIRQLFAELLGYIGQFKKAKRYLRMSTAYCERTQDLRGYVIDLMTLSELNFLQSDPEGARQHAEMARDKLQELWKTQKFEAGVVTTEWLLGAAELLLGNPALAAIRLEDALMGSRRINLVELEARILLEHAKLALTRSEAEVETDGHMRLWQESHRFALDALAIAQRSGYRLQEAEIQNFLAKAFFKIGEPVKARHHAEIAKDRASCDVDPRTSPYYYRLAYEEASRLLRTG